MKTVARNTELSLIVSELCNCTSSPSLKHHHAGRDYLCADNFVPESKTVDGFEFKQRLQRVASTFEVCCWALMQLEEKPNEVKVEKCTCTAGTMYTTSKEGHCYSAIVS